LNKKYIIVFLAVIIFSACATYYNKNLKFQEKLAQGDIEKAEKILENDKKTAEGKNRLLYLLNRGYVSWLLQDYNNSNSFFASADIVIEDQIKKLGSEILALAVNSTIKPYRPEDFEYVLINYFKALNYISLEDLEAALVEVRKINIKLNKLNDKYPKHKNRYSDDAFAHLIMGLIYDAQNDYNNAFIAYRNAYDVYKKDYVNNFGVNIPEQLKKDILRTAYLTGFYEEVRQYEKEFGIQYDKNKKNEAELIFFWLNGLGPVKAEWSINFTVLPGGNGVFTFVNEDLGLNIPIYTNNFSKEERAAFSDLKFLRIAFPKYIERMPVYTNAKIINNNLDYQLEMAENINEIAFKTLNDRMLREIGNSLARFAVKKALEITASKQNQNLGTIVSIANAITEKADTRNWQTLPYSISYCRIPLKAGENNLKLMTSQKGRWNTSTNININAQKGKTYFYSFHNLDSYPVNQYY